MPGYNVVGIDCDSGNDNIIALSGAIHCITHTVAVEDSMISHLPLDDTEDTDNAYVVNAELPATLPGIANATLSWATNPEGPWTDVAMTETIALLLWSEYEANIPAQAEGTQVYYYVSAEANSGKSGARPMPAPEGWLFRVLGETSSLDNVAATTPWRTLYPNPARHHPLPELNLPQATDCRITLHNTFGQQVKLLHDGTLNRGVQRVFLNAATLPTGPYF